MCMHMYMNVAHATNSEKCISWNMNVLRKVFFIIKHLELVGRIFKLFSAKEQKFAS